MSTATMTSKGQTTIPKDIREKLRLKPGDRIHFVTLPDGTVRLLAQNLPIAALKHMLGKPKRTLTVEEMNEAIGKAVAAKHRRAVDRR
jgi:AbrB family looped-hinge helix DNA binding protein